MAYASRTGTKRNLEALAAAGWGLMVSATGSHRTEGFHRYAIDNGAWTAYQQGKPWNEDAFLRLVEMLGDRARFIVVPDIVGDGEASLEHSFRWVQRLKGDGFKHLLLAVQDGMEPWQVDEFMAMFGVGLFLGGTTEWKLGTMFKWGQLARRRGAYFHVGRVNSIRRIRMCAAAGADSFDGTSVTRFAVTLPRLDLARRQIHWVW